MIVEQLLGWTTFLLIATGIASIYKKNSKIFNFLLVAFLVRSFLVILDQYYITLPDSDGDAATYEKIALRYSNEFGLNILFKLFENDSFFISRLIALLYSILERSPMMIKFICVGFGTGSVYLIYRLSLILWGHSIALKTGWFAAFFPSLVLYSCVIMKEIFIIFFLFYALNYSLLFFKERNKIYFFKASIGYLITTLFHGPMAIGFAFFSIYLFIDILKMNNYFIYFNKKNLKFLIILPVIIFPLIAYVSGVFEVNKLGNFKNLILNDDEYNKKNIIYKIKLSSRPSMDFGSEGAAYPQWLIPENKKEIFYLTPLRVFYFLYSPFPWDLKRLVHIVGLFDSLLYIYLSICAWRNRKSLYSNPLTKFVLIIFFLYIFIYSWGVGNFGTGIRHRLKFFGILIAIAAPKIFRLKLSKN